MKRFIKFLADECGEKYLLLLYKNRCIPGDPQVRGKEYECIGEIPVFDWVKEKENI